MNDKVRCQSCGMPLSDAFGNYGTQTDGSNHPDYCIFCFKDGGFTLPHQTLDEMIQRSIENMTMEPGMSEDKARELAFAFTPRLKRWR